MTPAMKKALDEAAEKFADVFFHGDNLNPSDMKISFDAGATWLIEYLGKDVEAWDARAAHVKALDGGWQENEIQAYKNGARWQFEQDKVRIGMAETNSQALMSRNQDLEKLVLSLEAKIVDMKGQVGASRIFAQNLEARLAAMTEERNRWRDGEFGPEDF